MNHRRRDENKRQGDLYLAQGDEKKAQEFYQKAVDITPHMAFQLIKALRQHNISYIVAPFEADAQLAFMSIYKFVDCVITEDSDLLAFGCPRVI